MPAPFEELVGSPRVSIADGKFTGVRKFKISWHDSLEFAVDLLGGWIAVGSSFVVSAGAAFPGFPLAVCTSFSLEPFPEDAIAVPSSMDVGTSTNQPPYGIVTATYTIRDGNPESQPEETPPSDDGTRLSYQGSGGAEMLSLPSTAFKYADGGALDANVPTGLMIPTEEFTLTWERVPEPNWTFIKSQRGMVNRDHFMGHKKGTVLFMGFETSREQQFSGQVLWRITFRFKVKEAFGSNNTKQKYGWNYVYSSRESGENWRKVVSAATGKPIYPEEGNFDQLFRMA